MAEKSKPPKKKSKSPATRSVAALAAARKSKRTQRKATYYVNIVELAPIISDHKHSTSDHSRQFASFEEAKSAAIDAIVAAIEQAEGQLHDLKRATGYDQLHQRLTSLAIAERKTVSGFAPFCGRNRMASEAARSKTVSDFRVAGQSAGARSYSIPARH